MRILLALVGVPGLVLAQRANNGEIMALVPK